MQTYNNTEQERPVGASAGHMSKGALRSLSHGTHATSPTESQGSYLTWDGLECIRCAPRKKLTTKNPGPKKKNKREKDHSSVHVALW